MDNINIEVPDEPHEDPGYQDAELEQQVEPEEEDDLVIDQESSNLVPDLEATTEGQKFLKGLVQDIHDEFMMAWDKNAAYRARRSLATSAR
jgi:hypothetical protein